MTDRGEVRIMTKRGEVKEKKERIDNEGTHRVFIYHRNLKLITAAYRSGIESSASGR